MNELEHHYKPEDVAERLNVHISVIYRLVASGELRSVRVGRARRIPDSALRAYLDGERDEEDHQASVVQMRRA